MIEVEKIKSLVEEKIEGTDMFLVDLNIDAKNNIHIFVDSPNGVEVTECVGVSRHVEHSLDREEEDFALEVSSPGIGYPFLVPQQYQKAIGRNVEVLFSNGLKQQGELKSADVENITISYMVKERPEGAKRPKMVEKTETIALSEVKSTKEIIIF